jgi:hypothetical protein
MATRENVISISLPAAADYSTTGQYLGMYINSSGQWQKQTSAGGAVQGVLQNNPASGEAAEVAVYGKCLMELGGTVAAGARVQITTDGTGITAASGDNVVGVCVNGGEDGDIAEVLLTSIHVLA